MKEPYQIKENLIIYYDSIEGWLLKGVNGTYAIEHGDFSMYLLPLLEKNYDDFCKKMFNDDDGKKIKNFPLLPLLKFPFEKNMEYWADYSLVWIEESSSMTDLIDWAKSLQIDWMPLKLKHKFWKVFKIRSYNP